MNRKQRSFTEIVANILEVANSHEGSMPTRIMYGSNLAYKTRLYYFDKLLSFGLLETVTSESKIRYRTTEKGRNYLHYYRKLIDLMGQED